MDTLVNVDSLSRSDLEGVKIEVIKREDLQRGDIVLISHDEYPGEGTAKMLVALFSPARVLFKLTSQKIEIIRAQSPHKDIV